MTHYCFKCMFSFLDFRMGAAYLLCFCTHLFLFVQQSNGQPQKTPAEWDSRQAALFPNPLLNDRKCQVSIPMRICDPNTVLPSQPSNSILFISSSTHIDLNIQYLVLSFMLFN